MKYEHIGCHLYILLTNLIILLHCIYQNNRSSCSFHRSSAPFPGSSPASGLGSSPPPGPGSSPAPGPGSSPAPGSTPGIPSPQTHQDLPPPR